MYNSIRNPQESQQSYINSPLGKKRVVGTSIVNSTHLRFFNFCDKNGELTYDKGIITLLTLLNELTEFILVIKRIFDTVTDEKDYRFLEVGRKNMLSDDQRKLFTYKVKKIVIDKREEDYRAIITDENKQNMLFAKRVHRRLKEYKESNQLESMTHAVDTALDSLYDLRELILILKEVFKTALERKDYREVQYDFNRRMTLDLTIIFNKILLGEMNAK